MSFEFHSNTIDVSELTDRHEELESDLNDFLDEHNLGETYTDALDFATVIRDHSDRIDKFGMDTAETVSKCEEFYDLNEVLDELRGNGGDHQWNGDWFPGQLIADSYFTDAMRDLVEDIGDTKSPDYLVIDWDATARNLQVDYSSIDIDGSTYWYR